MGITIQLNVRYVKFLVFMVSMNKSNRQNFKLEVDLHTLRALIAVVEEGGFSAAAKRVHRTQSAVSVQIAKLENQLNTKLLERTSRSISVTPAGESFLSYARRIVELADEANLVVTAPDVETVLRVGFVEYLAPQHLHKLLARFRKTHPNCELNLTVNWGPQLLEDLKKGKLDVVFAGPEVPGGHMLWEEEMVWTGNEDLIGEPSDTLNLVLMPPPCSYRKIVFDSLTSIAKPWKLAIEANSVPAVQSSIRAGLGVTILPRTAVLEDMPIIRDRLPELKNTSVMSFVNEDVSNPYAVRFVDYLIACMEV